MKLPAIVFAAYATCVLSAVLPTNPNLNGDPNAPNALALGLAYGSASVFKTSTDAAMAERDELVLRTSQNLNGDPDAPNALALGLAYGSPSTFDASTEAVVTKRFVDSLPFFSNLLHAADFVAPGEFSASTTLRGQDLEASPQDVYAPAGRGTCAVR